MTYATFITSLRNQSGDTKRRVHVDWTGDGSTTVFQMPADTFPVLESSYTLKVAGVTKTENTDYTLDKNAGTIVFINTAPSNDAAITLDSIAVYLTDADWLDVINAVIKSLGNDFWKEFVDTTLTATANMLSLSLVSAQPYCISVYQFQRRTSTNQDWVPVEEDVNWRYDKDNNIIYIGNLNAFPLTGELLRIRGLKKYVLGTATTDSVDVQDGFLTIIEYGCLARYWRWRYKDVVELVSKLNQESTRTPLQELIMLSDRFDRLYEIEKGKLKPNKPAYIIPVHREGGGRP